MVVNKMTGKKGVLFSEIYVKELVTTVQELFFTDEEE